MERLQKCAITLHKSIISCSMKWPNIFLAWLVVDIPCMILGIARIVSMIVCASCALGTGDIWSSCSVSWITGLPQRYLADGRPDWACKDLLTWQDWVKFFAISCVYLFLMGMYR